MEDNAIIDLFFKRDEQAVKEIKKKYEKLCMSVSGNILSYHEDTEECLNSAYLDIWNQIPPDKPKNLRAYLCRIVKNKALDKLKYNSAQKRNANYVLSLDELSECIPSPDENNLTSKQLAELINSFLRTQDKKHRMIFVRRYWYCDSPQNIARLYNMNEKTVNTCLFRTREKLRQFLRKEGYDHG